MKAKWSLVAALGVAVMAWAVWPRSSPEWLSLTPVQGHVVLFGAQNRLALQTFDGTTVWTVEDVPSDTYRPARARLTDERLYAALDGEGTWTLEARDAETGALAWSQRVTGSAPETQWTLTDNLVLVVDEPAESSGTLRALESKSGKTVWQVPLATDGWSAWARDGHLIISAGGRVRHLRLRDGAVLRDAAAAAVCVIDDEVWSHDEGSSLLRRVGLDGRPLGTVQPPTTSFELQRCGTRQRHVVILHAASEGQGAVSWYDRDAQTWTATAVFEPALRPSTDGAPRFAVDVAQWRPGMPRHVFVAGNRTDAGRAHAVASVDLDGRKVLWQAPVEGDGLTAQMAVDGEQVVQRLVGRRDMVVSYSVASGAPTRALELKTQGQKLAMHHAAGLRDGALWFVADGKPTRLKLATAPATAVPLARAPR